MALVCPHCQSTWEASPGHAAGECVCPACGSSFHLESTVGWRPAEGERKLGRFELLDLLGTGAFGSVYKARDPKLDRVVAIKVPRDRVLTSPAERERLVREARSAAQLSHPGIVRVHEIDESDGVTFLVSEFVDGVTLADQLSARRPGFVESARLVAALAQALHYAHENGVVHRDIKPSNVMIDPQGRPRLMDFGLARRDSIEITVTVEGQVLGTPAYMPPEQARGEGHAVDRRADVYSLGVVLYQLLTGELPFRGTARMLLHQVLHDEPRPPRRLNDRIPRDLETITLKAMAKEPPRRYATAGELADDLERYLNHQPIHARPPSVWYRLRKFTARNRAVVGGVLATFLALLLGVVGTSLALWQAREALTETERQKQYAEGETAKAREAERQRKVELARTHAIAARLAGQRGQWREALGHYDQALAAGAGDEVGLWLGKLEARVVLYQVKEFRTELAALSGRTDLGEHAGRVRLLEGFDRMMRSRKPKDDPLDKVREALKLELPPADRAYAEAMLAPNVPEMIRHLHRALEADPFHRRACDMLTMALFISGRVPEARDALTRFRAMSPNTINTHVYHLMLSAVEGNRGEAERACERLRPSLGAEGVEMGRFMVRLFSLLVSEEFLWADGLTGRLVGVMLEIPTQTPRLARLMGAGDEAAGASWNDFSMLQMPALSPLANSSILGGASSGKLLQMALNPGTLADELTRLTGRIPSGYNHHLRGQLLFRANRLDEAEAALRQAQATPSFGDFQRRATFELLLVLMRQWEKARPGERDKLREEARKQLLRLAGWGTYPPWALREMSRAALALGEPAVALAHAQTWIRRAPNDTAALQTRLNAEFALGAYFQAAQTAQEVLKKDPQRGETYLWRGVAAYNLNVPSAALAHMLEAQRLVPAAPTLPGNFKAIENQIRRQQAEAPILLEKLQLREALVQARQGDHAGAVARVKGLAGKDAAVRVAVACVYARASAAARQDKKLPDAAKEAERLAGEAVAQLEAARASGYFADPFRRRYLGAERDFEVLRQRADFKELLAPPRGK